MFPAGFGELGLYDASGMIGTFGLGASDLKLSKHSFRRRATYSPMNYYEFPDAIIYVGVL
ncbi:hypothetical protein GCM10009077_33380 [Roseibium denhamense]